MDTLSASGTLTAREPLAVTFCAVCGQPLSLDVEYTGTRLVVRTLDWPHDGTGIYCPRCRPLDVGGDPSLYDGAYDAAGKETAILDALDGHPDGLTVKKLAAETGLARGTIYRRLETLERRGEIRRDGNKFFMSQP